MKKDIFDFRRFGKYFMSDIRTCMANYGLSLLTIPVFSLTTIYIFDIVTDLIMGKEWSGPGEGFRFFLFMVAIACIIITMPVKCYGKLTEKQYGSQWLMIPASKLEKVLSMFLLTSIIVPLAGGLLYLGLDALICALDHTCGESLISWAINLENVMNEFFVEENIAEEPEFGMVMNFINQLKSPWLYIDDCIQITLPFLLGAIFFKNGKTVKTFLTIAVFGTVVGIISTPLMIDWTKTMAEMNVDGNNIIVAERFFNSWIIRNIALFDTISDTITNLILMAAIYFRIKTLKH